MKKIFCFLAVASTAFFASCSSDDSGDDNTTTPPVVEEEVTAITVTSNTPSVELGNAFVLTTKDQDGNTLTQGVTYTVADAAITSPWAPAAVGTYTVVAHYAELTAQVNVTVTEEEVPVAPVASDSFVIGDTNYETNLGAFAFNGIYSTETEGEYIIVWAFNPYFTDGTSYPNDVYIYFSKPITPTGTDEETGQPTFTLVYPIAESHSWATDIDDVWIVANNSALLPETAEERLASISDVTLDITALQFAQAEGDTSNLEATYTITLTDGTVINGEYSGETGIYDATQAGRNINAKTVKLSKGVKHLNKR